MKKFRFTLVKIRDYKRQILEREKGTLFGLYTRLNELEQRYSTLSEDFSRLCRLSEEDMRKGTGIREIQIYEMKKNAVRNEQERITEQKKETEELIEKQRKTVIRLSQEVSGLNKLEETQKHEYLYRYEQENQRTVEEFMSLRLRKNKENEVYDPGNF